MERKTTCSEEAVVDGVPDLLRPPPMSVPCNFL